MFGRSTEHVLIRHCGKKVPHGASVDYYFVPPSHVFSDLYLRSSVVNLYPSFVQVLRSCMRKGHRTKGIKIQLR